MRVSDALFFIAIFAGPGLWQPAYSAESSPEWVVKQLQDTLYLSKDAVKGTNLSYGFHVVAKAPDWRVTCYRTDRKIVWTGDLKDFNGVAMAKPFGDATMRPALPPGKKVNIEGYKCTEYVSAYGRLYGSDDIKLPPKAIEFVIRYLYTGTIPQVPLFYFKNRETNKKYVEKDWFDPKRYSDSTPVGGLLRTKSIEKKQYTAADFAIPTGYRKVSKPSDIALSEDKRTQFVEMFEGLGYTTKKKD